MVVFYGNRSAGDGMTQGQAGISFIDSRIKMNVV